MKVTKKQIEVERDTYKALYEDMRSALRSAIAMHEKTNAKTWAPLEEQMFWRNLRNLVEEHTP